MKIAIIGAGNMGGSIARGLAKGSLIDDSDIIVSNPSAGKLEKLKKEFPCISTTNNNLEAATGADIVILAVKPWFMESVMRELKLKSKQILISVAAGISFEELAHYVVAPEMPMFRLIPNPAISEKSPPMAMYAPARNASMRVLPAVFCSLSAAELPASARTSLGVLIRVIKFGSKPQR